MQLNNLPYNIRKKDIKEFFRQNIPFSIRIPRNIKGIAFVGYKTEKAFKQALAKDKSFLSELSEFCWHIFKVVFQGVNKLGLCIMKLKDQKWKKLMLSSLSGKVRRRR